MSATARGELVFEDNQAATVNYSLEERRGRVSHAEGHPDWHPIIALNPGPFTLVLTDGRKLTVTLVNLRGDFQGTGDFF
jgi:hypothetical protein